jgi:hypothetical protein
MDISSLLTVLGTASPYVATVAAIVIIIYMVIQYRTKKQETSEVEALDARLGKIESKMDQHDKGANDRHAAMTEMFGLMLKELQTISAANTGTLSPEDSKRIIRNQFRWAREELLKIARASIARNHFRGRENQVSGKVYRAWFQTGKASFDSIDQFDSVKFPYHPLYSHILPQIWLTAWDLIIPVYHYNSCDYKPSQADIDARFEEAANSISMMYDSVLSIYFSSIEDPELGLAYSGIKLETQLIEDPSIPEEMAKRMKDYVNYKQSGGCTDKWTTTPSLESIRILVSGTLADLTGKESKLYQRVKSDANIPAMV